MDDKQEVNNNDKFLEDSNTDQPYSHKLLPEIINLEDLNIKILFYIILVSILLFISVDNHQQTMKYQIFYEKRHLK